MKNKSKVRFRIGAMCLIAMFLLLPLLSSPVAAAFTQNLGSVTTNNTPGGPTAGGICGAPATVFDVAPWNARFQVNYTYVDSNPGGSGSTHWTQITGSYQPAGAGPWFPFTFTQTAISIPSNGGPRTGTYTTPWIVGYGGKGTNFNIYVIVNCQDTATTTTATWTSNLISFTII